MKRSDPWAPARWLARPAPLALAVSLSSLGLYVATLAPGLLWGGGDFAAFQTWAYLGSIGRGSGAFWHPLWPILAHPFTWLPIRDVAWRANLAAAVFGAGAIGLTYLAAWSVTRSRIASLLAAAALAISHTFWTYAVMPKVYSLNALFLAACIYLLLRWREKGRPGYLCLSAFLFGLSFLNHLVMVTAAAGFAAFVGAVAWRRRRWRGLGQAWLAAGASFALGLAPYLYLAAQAGMARATGAVAAGFLAGLLYVFSHPGVLARALGWGLLLGAYQYPLAALAGLWGIWRLWRQDQSVALLVILSLLGTLAFMLAAADPAAGGVYVWNLHYYLQAYAIFALALAAGLEAVWTLWCRQRIPRQAAIVACALAVPVLVYLVAPGLTRAFWTNVPDFRPLPGRDNLTYVLSPWKQGETGARDLGEGILRALPPDSVFFADYSIWAVVNYLQVVERARPDVTLVELPGAQAQVPLILQYRGRPNLFLADVYRYYDLEGIRQHFDVVPAGPIYRLVPK